MAVELALQECMSVPSLRARTILLKFIGGIKLFPLPASSYIRFKALEGMVDTDEYI